MACESFQIITVSRIYGEEIELIQALGFPEVSALGEEEAAARAGLNAKLKDVLEDANLSPARWLHRRMISGEAELDRVEVTLRPGKRSLAWQQEVKLWVRYVRWKEE